MARGLQARLAGLLVLLGELDDQDRVLRRQADEHHEADLGQDVVVQPHQPDAGHGGKQAHRHDQDDRQRQHQALVLGGKQQEDEHHSEREGDRPGGARLLLLEGQFGPVIGEALR